MIIDAIDFDYNSESRRDAIQSNVGQQVILLDSHNCWIHGRILEERDAVTYHIHAADPRGRIRLHYDDLDQLLVLRNHPDFPRPQIRL